MQDKETLLAQLNRLAQDAAGLQISITKFNQEISDAESKIKNLSQNMDRHQGALNYNAMLAESIKKQLEEIELAAIKPQ